MFIKDDLIRAPRARGKTRSNAVDFIVKDQVLKKWFHLKDFTAHLDLATNQDPRQFPKLGNFDVSWKIQTVLEYNTKSKKYVVAALM